MVWLDGQGLRRNMIGKLDKDIWGGGMWIELSEWEKT